MGMEAGDHHGLDAQFLQEDIQVGLEESAIAALGDDEVGRGGFQFGNDVGSGGALDGVVAPKLQFTVDSGKVAIIAEDDRHAGGTGRIQKAGSSRNNLPGAVAAQGTGHEVVEHVNDQNRRMIQFFHFSN